MSAITIQPIGIPLPGRDVEDKKQVLRNEKSVSIQTVSKPTDWPVDTVTLSSEQADENNPFTRLKPSQPVTFEENQALRSTFSRHA